MPKFSEYYLKLKRKISDKILTKTYDTPFQFIIFRSYWHYKLLGNKTVFKSECRYFTQKPNYGAGIGHQMSNWISGLYYSGVFGLKFIHYPFSTGNWEDFLGFGQDEELAQDLLKKKYKKVRLPLFDGHNVQQVNLVRNIISSYKDKKVIFHAAQDQYYAEQCGVIDSLQAKFFNAQSRFNDKLIYSKDNYNIAIHVRRGDITIGQVNNNPNLLMRWQGNDYFEKVLRQTVDNIKIDKPIFIYLFSQGKPEDFSEFANFDNINFCLDMGAKDSFLHMVYADVLITSKSSFSYKPALINKGIKICPINFWHSYPETADFVMVDDLGNFVAVNHLNELFK
jgi:hypothetical protein